MRAGVPRGKGGEEEEAVPDVAAAAAAAVHDELTSAEGKAPGLTFLFDSGGALALTFVAPPLLLDATTTPERAEAATRLETSLSSAGMISSEESNKHLPLFPPPPPPRVGATTSDGNGETDGISGSGSDPDLANNFL